MEIVQVWFTSPDLPGEGFITYAFPEGTPDERILYALERPDRKPVRIGWRRPATPEEYEIS